MKDKINRTIPMFMILFSGIFFIWFSVESEASWGGADSFVHYMISHYSFKYPNLFLDLWGKPLFTILSSPFSQFGFQGIKLFNVLVSLFTAWFAFKICEFYKLRFAYLAIPFVLFAPIYFLLIPSGLTELLFGLVIILSVWFFLNERYLVSAIIISFLPFARNEGFILIPFFILAFLLKRKFKVLPFVLTGFVFFSLLGWKHFGNLFWIIQKNPYQGAADIYGSGSLFHFAERLPQIIGVPILFLFAIGLIFILYDYIFVKSSRSLNSYFLLLIVFPLLTYFSAHSYVWWKGLGSSLGLTRVMAGIVPLSAIIAVKGIDWLASRFQNHKIVQYLINSIFLILVIYLPFNNHRIPFKFDGAEKLLKQSSGWLVSEGLDKKLIYYYDPMYCYFLNKDIFNGEEVRQQIQNRDNPGEEVVLGAIVLWDAHFGPNEGRMPIEKLKNNDDFVLLKHFVPEVPFKVLNNYNYEIYVFQRK